MTSDSAVDSSALAIVLAAGLGTRMQSGQLKLLHDLAGRPILEHVLSTLKEASVDSIALVVGPESMSPPIDSHFSPLSPPVCLYLQAKRLGTAHAALAAQEAHPENYDQVLILFGDSPLIRPETLRKVRTALTQEADLVLTAFESENSNTYGRILMREEKIEAIREYKDASLAERDLRLCFAGVMGLKGKYFLPLLQEIRPHNVAQEYYLTEAVQIAAQQGLKVCPIFTDEEEILGINDRLQLAQAEAVYQNRLRQKALQGGVTLKDPGSVFFSYDTMLDADVIVEPHVVFGTGVRVREGAKICAFSYLEGAQIGAHATVGPFARLRPGTQLEEKSKIGNFVEIKNAHVGTEAKINHLSYIGDAQIGSKANIGAGTITCNYDGWRKSQTYIGAGAFIGSHSALVAPVEIGAGAYVGSGSVITENVPPNALALTRSPQLNKLNWAEERREKGRRDRQE